jgi:hypothetical protein
MSVFIRDRSESVFFGDRSATALLGDQRPCRSAAKRRRRRTR